MVNLILRKNEKFLKSLVCNTLIYIENSLHFNFIQPCDQFFELNDLILELLQYSFENLTR